ncbi:hypothetical protein HY468_00040 [Candidatus Roizmanbacteria bacterium]|nr:hypothetical protein [Candidatus Roizmanbacteria bacterium]
MNSNIARLVIFMLTQIVQMRRTFLKWYGIAIAAHPKEKRGLSALSFNEIAQLQHKLDGIEVVTLKGYNETAAQLATQYNLAAMGSSDSHMLVQVGLVATKLFGKPETWEDVIDIIRQRKTDAFIRSDIPDYAQRTLSKMILYQILDKQPRDEELTSGE